MTSCDLVLCVSVGPGEVLGVLDILDAARAYLDGRYRVIIVDDSGGSSLWWRVRAYDEVDYLRNWKRRGFRHLVRSIQKAYGHVLSRYDCAAVLKLDTDAIITGPGLSSDILAYLGAHPKVGMLGAVSATESDRAHWQARLEANIDHWRALVAEAGRWGYRLGESALGGAYALSRPCLEAIGRAGYLSRHPQGERIAEDVTFSLFVRSLGYEIHEFGGREQPLALAWRGLPMAKEEVIARQKKVVHSVKFQIHDLRVRGYFERIRRQRMRRIEPAADGRSTRRALPTPAGVRRLRVGLLCRRLAVAAVGAGRLSRARCLLRRASAVGGWQPATWCLLTLCLFPRGIPRVLLGLGRQGRRFMQRLATRERPA